LHLIRLKLSDADEEHNIWNKIGGIVFAGTTINYKLGND